MKAKDLPEEIYFDRKVGSNGIHCLDYENESDIKYIRKDVVNKLLIANVSVMYCQCDELANINDSLIGMNTCVKCDKPIKR